MLAEQVLYNELIEGKRDQYQMEKRCIRKDGQVIWVDVKVSIIQYTNKDQKFLIALVEDINERKRYGRK
ncbi:MAG: PAS domain S-box protein [Desulfotomaculum sp.]|nr:PAS domain S-box protein [Desulfotomaculum sp.]